MKFFDFPIVFNYVVGCLSKSKELPKNDPPPFKEQIAQLNEMHVAPCKEFLFSKKKLIDIQPQKFNARRMQTQSSELSSKRNTVNKEFNLRKINTHRTHLQQSNNQNVITESLKSLNTIQKDSELKQLAQRQSIKLEKKEKKSKKKIRFDDDKQNFNIDSKVSISLLPSNASITKFQSKQLIGSKRHLGRIKTEMDQDFNKQFTNKRIKSVKKMIKKKKTLLAINLDHTQKQLTSDESNENTDKKLKSKKKLTFRDLDRPENSFKNLKSKFTLRSGSKKTLHSKRTLSKRKRHEYGSSNGNITGNQMQSKCSIKVIEPNMTKKSISTESKLKRLQTKTLHFILSEEDTIKDELKNTYKIKTEKIIKLNNEDNTKDNKKQDPDELQSSKSFKNFAKRIGDKNYLKLFKKKMFKEQTVLGANNTIKVAKRVKKPSNDGMCMQELENELYPTENQYKDRNYFMKSNFHKSKTETVNVFTELNIFHKMIKEYEGLFDDDKNEKDNSKDFVPNKPFAMMSQEVDKIDANSVEARKQQFQFEDAMIRFSKKLANKANELSQVHCV